MDLSTAGLRDYLVKFRGLLFSTTIKDAGVVLAGNVASASLAIVFSVFVARMIGPSDWGLVASVASMIGILVAFGELGLDAGLLRFVPGLWKSRKYAEARRVFEVVFTLRVLSALIIGIVLILFSHVLSGWIFNSADQRMVLFASVGFIAALMVDFQIVAMQSKLKWFNSAILLSLTNLMRVFLVVLMVLVGVEINLTTALSAFVGGSAVSWFLSLYWQRVVPRLEGDWRSVVAKLVPFSGWMGLNKIASSVNSRVDVIMLVALSGSFDAGIYAAASRLAMGVPLIVSSFATVLAPRFSTFSSKTDIEKYFKKSLGLSILMMIGLAVGIGIAPVVVLLFGQEYAESVIVFRFLLISFIPFILSVPAVNALIYAFKKPRILSVTSVALLPFVILFN